MCYLGCRCTKIIRTRMGDWSINGPPVDIDVHALNAPGCPIGMADICLIHVGKIYLVREITATRYVALRQTRVRQELLIETLHLTRVGIVIPSCSLSIDAIVHPVLPKSIREPGPLLREILPHEPILVGRHRRTGPDPIPILPIRPRLHLELVLEAGHGRREAVKFLFQGLPGRSRGPPSRVHDEGHAAREAIPNQLYHEELVDVRRRIDAREHDVARFSVEVLDLSPDVFGVRIDDARRRRNGR